MAIYFKPGLMVGDSVIDIVFLIIIGIRYRYNRGQIVAFYQQQQGMKDKCGVAAREPSLAESYRDGKRIRITKGKIGS